MPFPRFYHAARGPEAGAVALLALAVVTSLDGPSGEWLSLPRMLIGSAKDQLNT
jgi:hypothetical protein